jgi:hypothetical protein
VKQKEGINIRLHNKAVINGTIAVISFVFLFLIVYTMGRSNIFRYIFFTANGALDKFVYSQ